MGEGTILHKEVLDGLRNYRFAALILGVPIATAVTTHSIHFTTLVVAITLSGLLAHEIRSGTLILPIMTGKPYMHLVLSKFAVYGIVLLLASILSEGLSYLGCANFAFWRGLQTGIYLLFILSLLLVVGAILKSSLPTALVVLTISFGEMVLADRFGISRFLPIGLAYQSSQLAIGPLMVTVVLTLWALHRAAFRLSKANLFEYIRKG